MFVSKSMDLGMFNRVCPSLKIRVLIYQIRFDMSRSDKNSDRYVIPMHRKNVWTNKWMQYPRKNLLQISTMILVHSIARDHLKEIED
jgi:hypothetical protein